MISSGEDETRSLGSRLGRHARAGTVICLRGPLGGGKTTFVRGFARAAGFSGPVMSPTFGIARRYGARRFHIYHLDLFRIHPGDLANLGLEEYLDDPNAICLIEWPEAAEVLLPRDRLDIIFSHHPCGRSLRLRVSGPFSSMLLARMRPKPARGSKI